MLGLLPVLALEALPPLRRRRAVRRPRRPSEPAEAAKAAKDGPGELARAQAARRPAAGLHHARTPHPACVILVVVAAATGGTLTALAFVEGWGRIATVAPAGLLVGAGLFSLAMARFEIFVLALLVTRTSLDALKFGGDNAVLDPAALLGMLFLGAGVDLARSPTGARRAASRLSPLGWAVVGVRRRRPARHPGRPVVLAGPGRVDPARQRRA